MLDDKRAESNLIAKKIPTTKDDERQELIKIGRGLNQEISSHEEELRDLDKQYDEVMLEIPNVLAEDTPKGASDAENLVLRTHLTPRIFDFTPKDHVELGKSLDLIDFDAGAKVTGAKFYFLKNQAVILELALKLFAMKIAAEHGYTTLITPDLAKKSILSGTGFTLHQPS